jgi:hypothetical protein
VAVTGNVAVPAGPGCDGVDLAAWRSGFEEVFSRIAGLFVAGAAPDSPVDAAGIVVHRGA